MDPFVVEHAEIVCGSTQCADSDKQLNRVDAARIVPSRDRLEETLVSSLMRMSDPLNASCIRSAWTTGRLGDYASIALSRFPVL